ncbi:hypothetical protein KVT40_006761 [Elsinoe batatas]|uniref:Dynein light intermediate chain n=1 Tax=Elsinoe batatas TaxID=2601811 RepID=A0A8K0KXC7_9PEZI|nr:hypothetical protein KVT40_006761 [Elsinoe batatas]
MTTFQPTSRATNHNRIASTTKPAPPIWSTLLSTVSTRHRIPERHLLLLGSSPSSQSDLITQLFPPAPPSRRERPRLIPLANTHALGYTYRDLPSSDGEDTLARVNIHTLPSPSTAYAPLLTRLLTPSAIPNTSVILLLDWSRPWSFIPELLAWIRLLKTAVAPLTVESQHLLEDNNTEWLKRRDEDAQTSITDGVTRTPLSPGEFDDPLGLPVTVVVGNVVAMEGLEKNGWREGEFDFVLQFLRTGGLKHGMGIVYAAPGGEEGIRAVVYRGLKVEEERKGVKHNVVDREKVVVPAGWDSWGKIRVLREGFDIEGVSRAWGVDVEGSTNEQAGSTTEELWAARVSNPKVEDKEKPKIEVEHTPDQTFLGAQMERLEALRAEDEMAKKQRSQTRRTNVPEDSNGRPSIDEQIGPVQFNMGGIQYDADEALKRIKERTKQGSGQAQGTPERTRTRESTPFTPGSPPSFEAGKDIPVENLEAYFASLMKGGRGGSVQNSPRVASPRIVQKGSGEGSGT